MLFCQQHFLYSHHRSLSEWSKVFSILIDVPVEITTPISAKSISLTSLTTTKSKRLLSSKLSLSRRSNSNSNINNSNINNNSNSSDSQPHVLAFSLIELLVNYLFRECHQKLNEKSYVFILFYLIL